MSFRIDNFFREKQKYCFWCHLAMKEILWIFLILEKIRISLKISLNNQTDLRWIRGLFWMNENEVHEVKGGTVNDIILEKLSILHMHWVERHFYKKSNSNYNKPEWTSLEECYYKIPLIRPSLFSSISSSNIHVIVK